MSVHRRASFDVPDGVEEVHQLLLGGWNTVGQSRPQFDADRTNHVGAGEQTECTSAATLRRVYAFGNLRDEGCFTARSRCTVYAHQKGKIVPGDMCAYRNTSFL